MCVMLLTTRGRAPSDREIVLNARKARSHGIDGKSSNKLSPGVASSVYNSITGIWRCPQTSNYLKSSRASVLRRSTHSAWRKCAGSSVTNLRSSSFGRTSCRRPLSSPAVRNRPREGGGIRHSPGGSACPHVRGWHPCHSQRVNRVQGPLLKTHPPGLFDPRRGTLSCTPRSAGVRGTRRTWPHRGHRNRL